MNPFVLIPRLLTALLLALGLTFSAAPTLADALTTGAADTERPPLRARPDPGPGEGPLRRTAEAARTGAGHGHPAQSADHPLGL